MGLAAGKGVEFLITISLVECDMVSFCVAGICAPDFYGFPK